MRLALILGIVTGWLLMGAFIVIGGLTLEAIIWCGGTAMIGAAYMAGAREYGLDWVWTKP